MIKIEAKCQNIDRTTRKPCLTTHELEISDDWNYQNTLYALDKQFVSILNYHHDHTLNPNSKMGGHRNYYFNAKDRPTDFHGEIIKETFRYGDIILWVVKASFFPVTTKKLFLNLLALVI